MSKNKSVREELERIYGHKCMLHEGLNIKGYSHSKCKYKGKSIQKQLTLHHLKPLKENGKTNVENGAVVCRGCHDFIEQTTPENRERINNLLREYKKNFQECKIRQVDLSMEELTDLTIKVAEISFTEEIKPKEKYNRAKEKRKFEKRVEEEMEDER